METEAAAKKQALQGVFDRASSTYGELRYFPLLGEWLVDTAHIPDGAHVLDVACGHGAVLLPAAREVGARGQAIGIDLSEAMVRATDAVIHHLGLTQAKVLHMDAERLDFPDETFDYVLCGFALQFFPHLEHTLSEFKRVLKSVGRVATTTWGEEDQNWSWFDDLRSDYQAVVKLGSQSLDEREELFNWFIHAGFTDIQVVTKELDMIYANEEEWWTMQWSISGRAGLEQLEPKRLEQFKHDVFERMQPLRQADGFHDRLQAHCAVAAKP